MNFVALGVFLTYVAAAAFASRTGLRVEAGRRRVGWFLLVACAASFGAGLTQRDLWPFCAWPLVAGRVPVPVTQPRLFLVDAVGAEHAADYRAWRPLSYVELLSWLDREFLTLPPGEQRRAARFLVARAEAARARAVAAGRVPAGRLGPFTAPFFLLHPGHWSAPAGEGPPPTPVVGLRLYRDSWSVEERARDPRAVVRRLVYAFDGVRLP